MASETMLAVWLREQMKRRGLRQSQVASYVGLTPGSVSRWLSGISRPDPESCRRLAEVFHEPLEKVYALAGYPAEWEPPAIEHRPLRERSLEWLADLPIEIPVHPQEASAGFGQEIIDYVYWAPERVAGRNILGLRVKGDSMAPEIESGDTIFIDRDREPRTGDVVVATLGDQVYVKRLRRERGQTLLVGTNGSRLDAAGAKIEGVVIQLSRTLE